MLCAVSQENPCFFWAEMGMGIENIESSPEVKPEVTEACMEAYFWDSKSVVLRTERMHWPPHDLWADRV